MRTAIAAVLILAAGPAFAESITIPRVDIDQRCRETNFSNKWVKRTRAEEVVGCVRDAQVAYDALKLKWEKLTSIEQRECAKRIGPDAYVYAFGAMVTCVNSYRIDHEREEQWARSAAAKEKALQELPKQEFRY